MPPSPVSIGIVGAGLWGRNHALALTTHHRARVALVCDLDEARARRAAETFGCAWTTSLDEMAASDVTAVTIATPDHLHRDPAIAMLAAGKHVLVEKPLATTVADGRAMVEAAERAGVHLMVDFHARWHPLFMGAKGYVERGELGSPVMAYARLSDTIHVPTEMLSWGGQSGPEWFLFPHTMDIVRWLFEREPVEVYAKGHRGVLDGDGHQLLGRDPGDGRVRGRGVLHLRDLVDRAEQLHERRRQPPVALRPEGRPRAPQRALAVGVHRPVPHAVLVGVGDAVRQGVGLPVRVDPLLRRLRRRGTRRPNRPATTAWW